MTQRTLADQLHVTDKAVSKWERGLCYPDLPLLEHLAAALGLSVTELMTCQKKQNTTQPEDNEDTAMESLLHISGASLKTQRKTIWKKAGVLILVIISVAAGLFYWKSNVTEVRSDLIVHKQAEGNDWFIFVEEGDHLLRLQCKSQEMYDAIRVSDEQPYTIQCRWNRFTYRGTIETCEVNEGTLVVGSVMDQIGSGFDIGSLLGINCVSQAFDDIYPDPTRTGEYLFTYRFCYRGDGTQYFKKGEQPNKDLLVAEACRATVPADYDQDGIVELFVLTKYEEESYALYDLEGEKIILRYVDNVPNYIQKRFQSIISRNPTT